MIFPTIKLNTIFDKDSPIDGIFSIWGNFGVGKTTYALQIALNTIKNDKNVLFFYTKPNLPIDKINNLFKPQHNVITQKKKNFILIYLKDFDNLYKISFNLEFLFLKNLIEEKSISLIIIDSITDLYRLNLNINRKKDVITLNYQLNQILANLLYLNKKYKVEILIINEVSRKTEIGSTKEIQSGGNVMNYWISNALKIERTQKLKERKFILTHSTKNKVLEFKLNMTDFGFMN